MTATLLAVSNQRGKSNRVTPTKRRKEKEDAKSKLLQVRITPELWREIEIRRHTRTLAEGRNVGQGDVVEDHLRRAFDMPTKPPKD
jgi:hypothetical protein